MVLIATFFIVFDLSLLEPPFFPFAFAFSFSWTIILVSRIVRTIRTNKPYRILCREFLTDNVKFMSKACLFLSLCVSFLCKHFSYILYLVVLYFFCHCLPVLFSLFVYYIFIIARLFLFLCIYSISSLH